MAVILFGMGTFLALWCLFRLRRALIAGDEAVQRLTALSDELITTAEVTVALVAEQTESLEALLQRAAVERQAWAVGADAGAVAVRTAATPSSAILALAASGMSAPAIARRVGSSKAEVELVIGLHTTAGQR